MFCTSFVHMVETYGVRRAVLMTAGAFVVTLAAELAGEMADQLQAED